MKGGLSEYSVGFTTSYSILRLELSGQGHAQPLEPSFSIAALNIRRWMESSGGVVEES
jgi:hypothetical protein